MVAGVLSAYRIRVCGVLDSPRYGRNWRHRTFTTMAYDEATARRYALHKFNKTFPYTFTVTAITECSKIDSGD